MVLCKVEVQNTAAVMSLTGSMAALSVARRLVKSYFCVKCLDKNVHARLQTTARMFCVSESRSSKYSHCNCDEYGLMLHNSG